MKHFNSYKEYNIVNEGGIYGSILHPYNDSNLTFGEIKDMIMKVLSSDLKLGMKEKVDGLSIAVTYVEGNILFIRGKTHVIDKCKYALSGDEFRELFNKKGYEGFVKGSIVIEKLLNSIKDIDPMLLYNTFKNGENVLTFELLSKDFINVIKYDKNYLVLHELITYNLDGSIKYKNVDLFLELIDLIKTNEIDTIDDFYIESPIKINILSKEEAINLYIEKVNSILKLNNLTDHNKILDYKVQLKAIIYSLGEYVIHNMEHCIGKSQDNEIPSEGIVFNYNNNMYKLTGGFHSHMLKNLKK